MIGDVTQRRIVTSGTPSADEILRLSAIVGDRLHARVNELNRSMNKAIEDGLEELNQTDLLDMLHASVEGNISTILHMIRNSIPFDRIQPITAATEYASRLGQRGIPGASLRRAYHFGSDDMLAFIFEEVCELECPPDQQLRVLHHLSGWMYQYVDWITRTVLEVHEQGRRYAIEQNANAVSELVAKVLRSDEVSTSTFLERTGYRLAGRHVAATIWISGLTPAVDNLEQIGSATSQLASALRSSAKPLVMIIDQATAWVWISAPTPNPPMPITELLGRIVETHSGLHMALGPEGTGIEGFRSSHAQAETVKHVALVSTNPAMTVVDYRDEAMAVLSVLARDIELTRQWVRATLQALATDTDTASRLRETLRIFLGSGNSYAVTAELSNLHRNTIKYRLNRAAELIGRPLETNRLDIELALRAAEVFGSAVLTNPE